MKNKARIFRPLSIAAGAMALTAANAGMTGEMLFIGVDDANMDAYVMDPNTNAFTAVTLGVQVWGAAGDDAGQILYVSTGTSLSAFNYGTWTAVGGPVSITGSVSGAAIVMEGLGWMNGQLYGSRVANSATEPEGIYSIDTVTGVATLAHAYPTTAGQTNSGFDAGNGLFYATDDATATRGLISYDPNNSFARNHVADYPTGETDIDGLAIGGGAAWLLEDDASATGNIYRYDFGTQQYTSTATPWATSEVFSGAAYINIVPEPGTFVAVGVGLAGLLALRRRR